MTLDELAPAIHKSRATLSKCSRQLFPVPVKENLPDSIQITPEGMLKVVRQMNPTSGVSSPACCSPEKSMERFAFASAAQQ